MRILLTILILSCSISVSAQILPQSRSVDWTLAGLRDTTTQAFREIDLEDHGVVGDGVTPNDAMLASVFAAIADSGAILQFPAGDFLFNETIHVPDNTVIRGRGAEATTLLVNLGGSGNSISITGSSNKSFTSSITESAAKDSNFIVVAQPAGFVAGDWIQIIQEDADLVTSSWALNTVGQVVQISRIDNDRITLASPLRMDYEMDRLPYIQKFIPAKNVGIECVKIHRLDNTAPEQSSNIHYTRAVNCWVNDIESENCTFSHIKANQSSNLHISGSYFHHAFGYGSGGRAYGVMLQTTTNECLVEDNVFERLRHSMIMQSGANGNVYAYNYSRNPYWNMLPNDAAGDMVIHGNYPYANLFEQNIGQNIVIDNSHGPNGPNNTFFRNRAERYGIFFSANNSPYQNLIGNEITNNNLPYSLVNYTIQGYGHFIHGNNNKGNIHPSGTEVLDDISYAYTERPAFVPAAQWAGIGTPHAMNSASIPAYDRYHSGSIFGNRCEDFTVSTGPSFEIESAITVFPNPTSADIQIESDHLIRNLTVMNPVGQIMYYNSDVGFSSLIHTENWSNGLYLIRIEFDDNRSVTERMVKTNGF